MNPHATRRPVPDELFGGRLKESFLLDLEIAAVHDDVPWLRTITFRSSDLVGFEWKPGQDVMLTIPEVQPPARRRYTIRRADPIEGTLDIEVVLHGDGPFARWASNASAGERIDGIGPRGAITLRDDTAHHLLVGDESAIAATFAMLEALPLGASGHAVLGTEAEPPRVAAVPDADVVWTSVDAVLDALRVVPLPEGIAAYVNGERSLVRKAADVLAERGLPREAIATKAYWRRDQPNAAHGEPSKD